ncbi:MAG TPA: hypothetical protein VFP80_11605 [Thermoanaerobaculia bacterium]|nr:hypothetical protein [Thermoanaerobaculia bacterium]
MPTYTVRVQLHDDEPISLRGVQAIVRIVDGTLADAPYKVIREHRFHDVRYESDDLYVIVTDFRVGERPHARLWYVHVLVDVDHDGSASVGDFVTMESFPLRREGGTVEVVARRIRPVMA